MMKSNFLNLPSSASGDARRHVPFRSIINKHFSIFFVLVFVFSLMFSYVYPVAALADPVFQPVYDTQFYQLPQFVDPLNSTQQDIFYFILGSQVVEYAGLSDYQVENPYQDPSSVGEWFKKIGIDLYNDVLESFAITGAPVIAGAKWLKDLYANIAGAANFAGAFNNTSWSDWYNDVQTNGLSLELYPAMFGALNQYFAFNDGIYNWQFSEQQFENFVSYRSINASAINEINEYVGNGVRCNLYWNPDGIWWNVKTADTLFITYHNLFVNTSTLKVSIVDDNGNVFPTGMHLINDYTLRTGVYYYNSNYPQYDPETYLCDDTSDFPRNVDTRYGYSDYSFTVIENNYVQIVRDVFGNALNFTNSNGSVLPIYSDFINHCYVGSNWSNKQEIFNTDNLNFDLNNNQDTLAPVIDTLLDIKGLINDILEQNELKQPALDNLTDLNGDPLPATQLQPVSVAVELPDSGITINSGLFTPLTKDGGYINYLWYMTKPLVQYTYDFVQTLVFPDDTGEGFDAIGPGAIVFGVISLGLIGGLVVKCLL